MALEEQLEAFRDNKTRYAYQSIDASHYAVSNASASELPLGPHEQRGCGHGCIVLSVST